jgi:hypothetical protein
MEKYGRTAYYGYRIISQGLVGRVTLPEWDELPDQIKLAWIGAALAVIGAIEMPKEPPDNGNP